MHASSALEALNYMKHLVQDAIHVAIKVLASL